MNTYEDTSALRQAQGPDSEAPDAAMVARLAPEQFKAARHAVYTEPEDLEEE